MNKIKKIKKSLCPVEGSFADLSIFDFPGVYIIYDEKDDIVYVGSAYSRNIKDRLEQYKTKSKTGNTLANNICKLDNNLKDSDMINDEQLTEAIEIIKKFKILAIPHEDLEYKLIRENKPKYNLNGNKMK